MNPKIAHWSGKRVWLIGASSGIGEALARQLHALGARLALSSRHRERLDALGLNGALTLPCDATDEASLLGARAALLKNMGGVDIVIYLAGDYQPMHAESFNLAQAERLFNVNFMGALKLTSAVLNDLTPGGGIAFVSSMAGYRGLPNAMAYGPAKAALINFAECLYFDLAPKNIGVWIINPGFVATRLTAQNDFTMPALLTVEEAALATLQGFNSGSFEIHYPKRFTRLVKLFSWLPYSWYFYLVRRLGGGK